MDEVRKNLVLIVDDEEQNLKLMGLLLGRHGYAFQTAKSGAEALEIVKEISPDVIFLDVMMPGLDGYEVCRQVKANSETHHIPIVLVTGLTDRESRIRGLENGANDFLSKPFDATELVIKTKNLIRIKEFEDFLKEHTRLLEAEVKRRTSQLNLALQDLDKTNERLKEGYLDTVHRLTIVSEYRDEAATPHIRRSSYYCSLLASKLGWSKEETEILFYVSPMHDVGKVGIPSAVLLKPGELTPEESALMKTHTVIGARILHGSGTKFLQMAERIVLTHHERWDGSGYPKGLRAAEIPVEGRIMIIADIYDALRSGRPHKSPCPHERAFQIITEGDGRTMPEHFDPAILQTFRECAQEFDWIFETFREEANMTLDEFLQRTHVA